MFTESSKTWFSALGLPGGELLEGLAGDAITGRQVFGAWTSRRSQKLESGATVGPLASGE